MLDSDKGNKKDWSDRVAVYAVCNDLKYTCKALTTLASVKRYNVMADIFIVGPFSSADQEKAQELCARFGGNYIHLDLGDLFLDALNESELDHPAPGIRLPRNTFWHLYGYKLFTERGYKYSCHLDGDILCIRPIPFEEVYTHQHLLAGVFKKDEELNTGVLFYDHDLANEIHFFEKISEYYTTIRTKTPDDTRGHWRTYGDQALLNLAARDLSLPLNRLPSSFNYLIPRYYKERYLARNVTIYETLDETLLAHILHKPWYHRPEMQTYPMLKEALQRWWNFAEEIWEPEEIKQHFGDNPLNRATE